MTNNTPKRTAGMASTDQVDDDLEAAWSEYCEFCEILEEDDETAHGISDWQTNRVPT